MQKKCKLKCYLSWCHSPETYFTWQRIWSRKKYDQCNDMKRFHRCKNFILGLFGLSKDIRRKIKKKLDMVISLKTVLVLCLFKERYSLRKKVCEKVAHPYAEMYYLNGPKLFIHNTCGLNFITFHFKCFVYLHNLKLKCIFFLF